MAAPVKCAKVNVPSVFKYECFGVTASDSNSKKTKYKNLRLSHRRFNEKKLPMFDSMFQINYNRDMSSTIDSFMSFYNDFNKLQKEFAPFHLAVLMGNLHLMELLLKLPTNNVNIFTSTGFTGLHLAIRSNNLDIVKYLCDYPNIDLEASSTSVDTPLIYALLISSPVILKTLIDHGADVNKTFRADRLNSLMLAIRNDKREQCWMLATSNICPSHTDAKQWNALHYVATFKSSPNLLRKLIEIGCDQNGVTHEGMTPLHHAVISGNTDAVQIFLEINADVHKTDENGLTALHYAALQGLWEIVKMLLAAGSRPNKKTYNKVTALHFAAKHNHYLVVKELLKCRVDVNAITLQCNTPLHYAACNGNEEMVGILLQNGADINIPNKDNDLPIHLACLRGTINVVKLLYYNESNINDRNKKNMLPLHNAVISANEELIMFLLAKCKLDIDSDLYFMAIRSGNINIIKILIDRTYNDKLLKEEIFWHKLISFSASLEIIKLFANRVQPPTSAISSLVGFATQLGYCDIARYLLKTSKTWDDFVDDEGNSVLYSAICKNDAQLVQLLIEKGSNVNHVNDSGISLLQYAMMNGNEEIVKLLLKNCADNKRLVYSYSV